MSSNFFISSVIVWERGQMPDVSSPLQLWAPIKSYMMYHSWRKVNCVLAFLLLFSAAVWLLWYVTMVTRLPWLPGEAASWGWEEEAGGRQLFRGSLSLCGSEDTWDSERDQILHPVQNPQPTLPRNNGTTQACVRGTLQEADKSSP